MPEPFGNPRLRSSLPSLDWRTFPTAVRDGLRLHVKSGEQPGESVPIFVESYPKQTNGQFDHSFDVITWKIVGTEMAGTDPSGTQRRPKGPTLREVYADAKKKGYSKVNYGWWENATFQFIVLSKDNTRANDLAAWFHRFMMRYAFYYKFFFARGINDFRFMQRLEDRVNKDFGQDLYERRLEYRVRLELLDEFDLRNLESLSVEFISPAGEITSLELPAEK